MLQNPLHSSKSRWMQHPPSFSSSQTPLLTKALHTVSLAAVISHPPLYFKPSDRGPLPLEWTPLSVWARAWASAHPRHLHPHKAAPASWCKGNSRGNPPDGAASLNLCPGYTLKVWGCSLKFAFLQESWHVCQGCTSWSAHRSMNLDWNRLN